MSYLYILSDRVNLFNPNEQDDFVIVNRDFDLVGTCLDLGFTNREEPIFNDQFYSIPLLYKPEFSTNYIKNLATFCENYHKKDERFSRFLVSINGLKGPQLVEATGDKYTHLKEHGQIKSEDIEQIIRGFNSKIRLLEKTLIY